MYINMDLS